MATKLTLHRTIFLPDRTIGTLYLNDAYLCDTLEDTCRFLENYIDKPEEGDKIKIYGETCIPKGTYKLEKHWWQKHNCYVPRLKNVPFFSGILIHTGNTIADTQGCILTGYHDKKTNNLINSRLAFRLLCEKVRNFDDAEITII